MADTNETRRQNLKADLESLRIGRQPDRARTRRRWPLFLLLAVVALAAAVGGAMRGRRLPVEVAYATRTDPVPDLARPVLSGSGYIVTGDRYVSIGVRVPGRIDRYFVEEGQTVRKGDPLVQLDDRDYRAALAQTEAELAVTRADSALAESELRRGRELRRSQVVSQQEFDILVNKADVARARIAQLEALLKKAHVDLEYTLLRAPSDGVVLAKLKEVGEIAVPGGFAGSGDLIRLANLTEIRAEVDVNEADLSRTRLGQPAEVIPDAFPDARYAAKVVKLYPQVDRQKGTLKIEVHVLQPDAKLLPDMSVRVTFLDPLSPEEAKRPMVTVPAAAVEASSDGESHVWLVVDGKTRRRAVKTAGSEGDQLRITEGLQGGEAVVVSDPQGLKDGVKVAVAN